MALCITWEGEAPADPIALSLPTAYRLPLTGSPMFPQRQSRSFLDPLVLSRLAALPLLARRPMQGTVSGRHPSPHRGASVEFAEYRKYVPGDDLRRLDWRAYGRSDRFYVKEFEADTNLRCHFVLDTSGSMDFGSQGISKFEYARRLIGGLGWLAVQQGDAVGYRALPVASSHPSPPVVTQHTSQSFTTSSNTPAPKAKRN